jgi:hypothetical protein
VQKLGSECVSSSTDQTFVCERFHGPIDAQLACSVAPFDIAHEGAFSQLTTVAWHADMNTSGLQVVNVNLNLILSSDGCRREVS